MEQLTHLDFEFGPGGWVKTNWRRGGGPEQSVWIRWAPPKRKRGGKPSERRWSMEEVRIADPLGKDVRFREIPLPRIYIAFNALEMADELYESLDDEVPADLERAMREKWQTQPRIKLERPAQRKLDDEFFRMVAQAYRGAVIRGLPPVKTIAEDAGVPHSTVARWIAQTRARKFLPPPQQGKVTV
jgi:hypothetical protein